MAKKFNKGLYPLPGITPIEILPKKPAQNDELLILLLLFILLAASPSLGLNSSYFFVVIMAVIGMGGVGKAFGLSR